ncbi:carbohydrate ABC transporter permease [Actinospica robiniae]|uniref:carbohydrate ABC transporter permease n=1 Tax=Actinospica robiniae TaxID=304901 RepID=UPI0003F71A98|nr:sugar ABC transporter permease [Actinospica robiniae]
MTLTAPATKPQQRQGAASRRAKVGRPRLAWALPGVLFFALFAIAPMLYSLYLSFCGSWSGIGPARFVGLQDWHRLLSDPAIRQATTLTVEMTVLSWLFQTPISLLIGVWAAGKQRNRAIMSALFFLPLVLSSTAISLLFKALLDPNFGLASTFGPWLGFPQGNILGSSHGALLALVFVGGWQFMPFHTLIYQGGARQIPKSLYEAASLDGAGRVSQFFHITLPQLRHTITTSSVLIIVGSLTSFEMVFLLTNGGPGTSSTTLSLAMYQNAFQNFDFGYASALGTALVIVSTLLSLVMVKFSGFGSMRSTREGM